MKHDYKNKPIKSLKCASHPDPTSYLEFRYEVELWSMYMKYDHF